MKIIFEGPDNVGKSTIIRKIIKKYKLPFVNIHQYAPPCSTPSDNELFSKQLYRQMFEIMRDNPYVISDRFYLGSMVYQKLYNRGFSGDFQLELENEYIENGTLDDVQLIVLTDSPENLVKREDGLSIETGYEFKIKEVELYNQAFDRCNIKNKLHIDLKNIQYDECFDLICDFLDKKYAK